MDPVVLQKAPPYNRCTNILEGLCVLQETVEAFLNSREFNNPALAAAIPCDFEFVVGNAETSVPSEVATPEITMSRSDLQLNLPAPNTLNNFGSAVVQPGLSIDFEIKAAYYKLAEMLTLELGQFLIVIAPYISQFNLRLASVICGSVKRHRETTPDYYFSKVTVNASVPTTTWKYPVIDGILRSIDLNVTMRGGAGSTAIELS